MKRRAIGFFIVLLGVVLSLGVRQHLIGQRTETIKVAKLDLKKAWNKAKKFGKDLGNKVRDAFKKGGAKVAQKVGKQVTKLTTKLEDSLFKIQRKIGPLVTAPIKKRMNKHILKVNPKQDVNTILQDLKLESAFRAGSPMSPREKKLLSAKFPKMQTFLKERMGYTIPLDLIPYVWIALSGGGHRANMYSYAVLSELDAHGWFENSTHVSTLSGSGWLVWPMYVWMAKTGGTVEQYRERLLSIVTHGPELWSLTHVKGITNRILRALVRGKSVSFADFYSSFLSSLLFHDFGKDGDPQQVYMDDIRELVESGKVPFPVLTMLSVPDTRFWTANIYEVGCPVLGLYVIEELFNRKGDKGPWDRETLGSYVGASSLAPGANMKEIYDQLFAQMKGTVGKVAKLLKMVGDLRFIYFEKEFPFQGYNDLPLYDTIKKKTYSQVKTYKITDPGVIFGNSFSVAVELLHYLLTEEKEKRPLILFVGEASANVGETEWNLIYKLLAGDNIDGKVYSIDAAGKRLLLPGPGENPQALAENLVSRLESDHVLAFYLPRIIDEKMIEKYKDDPRFKEAIKKMETMGSNAEVNKRYATFAEQIIERIKRLGTNADISSFFTTFKLKYPRQEAEDFVDLGKLNIRLAMMVMEEQISEFMLKWMKTYNPAAYEKAKEELAERTALTAAQAALGIGEIPSKPDEPAAPMYVAPGEPEKERVTEELPKQPPAAVPSALDTLLKGMEAGTKEEPAEEKTEEPTEDPVEYRQPDTPEVPEQEAPTVPESDQKLLKGLEALMG